jgi:hypothetical protein
MQIIKSIVYFYIGNDLEIFTANNIEKPMTKIILVISFVDK